MQIGAFESGTLTFTSDAVFPGNTDVIPFNKQSIIEMSHQRSHYSVGRPNSTHESVLLASDMAVLHVNERSDILPNHTLIKYACSFGSGYFDYDYAHSQISAAIGNTLGHAYLSSGSSGVTMAVMGVMQDLGVEIPTVGSSNTALSLSSREAWPLY